MLLQLFRPLHHSHLRIPGHEVPGRQPLLWEEESARNPGGKLPPIQGRHGPSGCLWAGEGQEHPWAKARGGRGRGGLIQEVLLQRPKAQPDHLLLDVILQDILGLLAGVAQVGHRHDP